MNDYAELRAALEPVTGQKWHAPGIGELHQENCRIIGSFLDCDTVDASERPQPAIDEADQLARYVAAACPDTIARLLAERDALEAEKYHLHRRLAAAEQERDQARSQHAQQAAIAAGVTDEPARVRLGQ